MTRAASHRHAGGNVLAGMQSVSVKREDGTIDTFQRAHVEAVVDALRLEELYWDEIRRATLGLARFSRGAIRFVGVWPVVLRLGPLVGSRRAILGGLITSRAGGTIAWRADGEQASVEVEGFAPLLQGSLWRLELSFHDLVGRRFLARVAREVP
jgi:hypothetical protein